MALSDSERQALLDRAAGLRAELSHQVARRDEAVTIASREREDAALVAEVAGLESQVTSAARAAEAAEVRVDDAAAIMLAAARQMEVVGKGDVTGESPATPATDNTTPDNIQGPEPELTPALLDEGSKAKTSQKEGSN